MSPSPRAYRRGHRRSMLLGLLLTAAVGLTDCTVDFTAPDGDGCGDGVVNEGEVCDGDALGTETCQSLGFDTGALACQSDCAEFDSSGCYSCSVSCGGIGCGGLSCGPNGMVCSTGICVCSGNGGTSENSESSCGDSYDNDCDGNTDCDDSNCDGVSCGPNGVVCSGGSCLCPGSGTEALCGDGVDNDCDGSTDCADTDCAGSSCGLHGLFCAGGDCACLGNGGPVQTPETTCSDGIDNDCDGLSDCDDPDCNSRTCNVGLGYVCNGQSCGPPP